MLALPIFPMSVDLEHLHRVHCVGIGGIGVSAVAKLLRMQGKEVTGSDTARTVVTEDAEREGIAVMDPDAANVLPDLDLLIHTGAAPETQVERQAAAKLGIPQLSYFEFLGLLSKGYRTIAVCGTNGKSTTTALLGLMLEAAGFDPLVVVGSRVPGFPHGNLRPGKGGIFVVEACEYREHFLQLSPAAAVVTNVTEDHLDYYRDLKHIRDAFQAFIDKVPEDGFLILNADDHVAREELKPRVRFRTFGLHGDADLRAENLATASGEQRFDVVRRIPSERWSDVRIKVPGRFNVANALAAASAARELGVDAETIRETLAKFRGIWRRFETVGEFKGATVVSDYGHVPEAIRETLSAAKEFYPGRRVTLVFEPHQHDRTRRLFDEFVAAFDGADVLVLNEIYGVEGRMQSLGEVSSRDLARAVIERDRLEGRSRRVDYGSSDEETLAIMKQTAQPGDLMIVMGAGSIDSLARRLCHPNR